MAPVEGKKAPPFNPMKIFSDASADRLRLASDTIYSAKVDGKLTVSRTAFPLSSPLLKSGLKLPTRAIELAIRRSLRSIDEGTVTVAALTVPEKGEDDLDPLEGSTARLPFRVVTENVSAIPKLDESEEEESSVEEVVIRLGERRWRVRGLERNMSFEQLRVNLLVATVGSEAFHVDALDLYSARQRGAFVRQAAAELGVKADAVKAELGKVLLKLEELQEERITKALEPRPARPAGTR